MGYPHIHRIHKEKEKKKQKKKEKRLRLFSLNKTSTDLGKVKVYFYYTDQKKADGAITDDELTPVVFENDKVVGWGIEFLDRNVTKQEIKMR